MAKDKCFNIPIKGGGYIRIHAAKYPDKKTREALASVFDAVYKAIVKCVVSHK